MICVFGMDRDEFISGVEKYFKDDLNIEVDDELKEDFLRAYRYLEEHGLAEDFNLSLIPVLADLYMKGIRSAQDYSVESTFNMMSRRGSSEPSDIAALCG